MRQPKAELPIEQEASDSDSSLSLRSYYSRRFGEHAEYRNQVWAILCKKVFQPWISPEAKVLDLGCGWGEFINQIQAQERLGMDVNPGAGVRLSQDVRFLQHDSSTTWPLASASLDVVFSSNFLEHLPDKASVERTLREAHRALRSGGILILVGPNVRCVSGAYWDFWDHHVPLTDRSLVEFLSHLGFSIQLQRARFLPYSMSQGMRPSPAWLHWYLRLPWLWRVLGKQFMIVCKK
jgi:SAM-dependent methyltransferase